MFLEMWRSTWHLDEHFTVELRAGYLFPGQAFGPDAGTALDIIQQGGFVDVEGYIVFNKTLVAGPPLEPPQNLRSYALPGAFVRQQGGSLRNANNNVGLRWDRAVH